MSNKIKKPFWVKIFGWGFQCTDGHTWQVDPENSARRHCTNKYCRERQVLMQKRYVKAGEPVVDWVSLNINEIISYDFEK